MTALLHISASPRGDQSESLALTLKQLIGVISQPGVVFGFDPENGYTGLLRGKRAAVIYTSAVYGVDRPPAFGSDFQSTFMEDWLRWAGINDIATVEFRPNLAVGPRHGSRERGMTTLAPRPHEHPDPRASPSDLALGYSSDGLADRRSR